MKPGNVLKHEFVEFIPDELEEGTIYISIRFATASHLCFCGCGNRVVTPIRPTDWKLMFDGKTVSLHPSIGNWSFPCQSHYWIKNNRVEWAPQWSREQIERGRSRDSSAKETYFGAADATPENAIKDNRKLPARAAKPGIWQVVKKWLLS
jgi:hypothetical protein